MQILASPEDLKTIIDNLLISCRSILNIDESKFTDKTVILVIDGEYINDDICFEFMKKASKSIGKSFDKVMNDFINEFYKNKDASGFIITGKNKDDDNDYLKMIVFRICDFHYDNVEKAIYLRVTSIINDIIWLFINYGMLNVQKRKIRGYIVKVYKHFKETYKMMGCCIKSARNKKW